eukprot:1142912-Pelagomonas_calceolata.AAC.13
MECNDENNDLRAAANLPPKPQHVQAAGCWRWACASSASQQHPGQPRIVCLHPLQPPLCIAPAGVCHALHYYLVLKKCSASSRCKQITHELARQRIRVQEYCLGARGLICWRTGRAQLRHALSWKDASQWHGAVELANLPEEKGRIVQVELQAPPAGRGFCLQELCAARIERDKQSSAFGSCALQEENGTENTTTWAVKRTSHN